MWFKSRQKPVEPEVPEAGPTTGKGRPTPTRREAEAQRKQALRIPSDPKEAKRAARMRAAQEREAARVARASGDERGLPARDAGPVRGFVRDFVDGRWTGGEFLLPLAIMVLLGGIIPSPEVQAWLSIFWMFMTLSIMADTTILLFRLERALQARWPDKADRKGASLYGLMRVIQLRRMRVPPPRVRRNGSPVVPKVAKAK